MAPIDPAQLLKALDPLLYDNCGIKEGSSSQFSSLMKKFSKKLVSRCVYVNVMKVTEPDVLEKLLDQGGWSTINNWLADAKETQNQFFLIKLLELCKLLPMTVGRLKENNTPKIVKSLIKFENEYIQTLSHDLVTKWMVIIKGGAADSEMTTEVNNVTEKKSKSKPSKDHNKEHKDAKKSGKKDSPSKKRKGEKHDALKVKGIKRNSIEKSPPPADKVNNVLKVESNPTSVPKKLKLNKLKRTSSESSGASLSEPNVKNEIKIEEPFPKKAKLDRLKKPLSKKTHDTLEDVKIDIKPELSPKKSLNERPKTVKSFSGKFRATGLETVAPLPKKIPKKAPTVNKTEAAVVAKNAIVKRLNSTVPERITEKKIKPENLLNINEAPTQAGGVKLIPAKPRPIHILQESASFMDALVAQPEPAIRRKKKPSPKTIIKPALNAPPTPPPVTSPPIKLPKLQFYKDTLEMNEEASSKAEDKDKNDTEENSSTKPSEENSGSEPDKTSESAPNNSTDAETKPTISDDVKSSVDNIPNNDTNNTIAEVKQETPVQPEPVYPGGLRPILSHSRKHKQKKSVRWVEDDKLKQMHYFELDETERENVLRTNHSFGEFKSIEAKRERELLELARRQPGDKMGEMIPWWNTPIIVKTNNQLVEPGYLSVEKEVQRLRHQSVLQAIYFTKNLIPESPQEPDSEMIPTQEPKIIPLDEENQLGSLVDYSSHKMPTPINSLPEVLSTLMNIPVSRSMNQPEPQPLSTNPMQYPPNAMSPTSPYDPGEPVIQVPTSIPKPMPPQMNMVQQPFNAPRIPMMEQDSMMRPMQPMPNTWNNIDPNMMGQENTFFQPGMMIPQLNPFPIMEPNIGPNIGPMTMSHAAQNANNNNNGNNMRRMRGGGLMGRPPMQPPYPRASGPRRGVPHVPCRHFALGGCRFGSNCSFLHPGVNGPPL